MSLRAALDAPLTYCSWLARHFFAIFALVLAGRAIWLGVILVTPKPAPSSPRAERHVEKESSSQSLMPERPDLKKIEALAGLDNATGLVASKGPEVVLRSIVVDFGPPRSEVFINGRLVGQSPYAGQVACKDGDTVRVAVLPRSGAPITREMRCLANEPVEHTASAVGPAGVPLPRENQTEEQRLLEERAKRRIDRLIQEQQAGP